MKNQYFGDINDYLKYGLLRLLTGMGGLRTAICWMLTANDSCTDGRFTHYLKSPDIWRGYDPLLYDCLKNLVLVENIRDVCAVESKGCLPGCIFYCAMLSDNTIERVAYFEEFAELSTDSDLVFFDPDNGLEVKSTPYGRKYSSKYLYWHEVETFFAAQNSLLIYQHFPRKQRTEYIRTVAGELRRRTGVEKVYSFRTPRVLFLLAPQDRDLKILHNSALDVPVRWGSQIQLTIHSLD